VGGNNKRESTRLQPGGYRESKEPTKWLQGEQGTNQVVTGGARNKVMIQVATKTKKREDDLRGSACARNDSGTEDFVVPGDSDNAGEGNVGVEGAGLFHLSDHDNVHRSRGGVGDVLYA